MIYSADELKSLAEAYSAATGLRLSRISRIAMQEKHKRVFEQIAEGRAISSKTAETLSRWFNDNWPPNTPWPLGTRAA